jgi:hypothetical protein
MVWHGRRLGDECQIRSTGCARALVRTRQVTSSTATRQRRILHDVIGGRPDEHITRVSTMAELLPHTFPNTA